jgi:Protein of unknown function (DUF3309)
VAREAKTDEGFRSIDTSLRFLRWNQRPGYALFPSAGRRIFIRRPLSGENTMSLGLILIIILIIFLLGGFSGRFGGYGYGMGHSGMGLGGVILVVLIILLLLGKL